MGSINLRSGRGGVSLISRGIVPAVLTDNVDRDREEAPDGGIGEHLLFWAVPADPPVFDHYDPADLRNDIVEVVRDKDEIGRAHV